MTLYNWAKSWLTDHFYSDLEVIAMVMCTSRHGHATVVLECHDPCEDTKYGKAEIVTLKHSYPVSILDILYK
jgi:hypothetical protein